MSIKDRLQSVASEAVNESEKAKVIARLLFKEVKDIEVKLADSEKIAKEIEERGVWGSLTASTGKDLVRIAKAQNAINNEMFGLIQETIALNVLSYSGLAGLLDEFRQCMEKGLVDANGRVIRLSTEGRELADTATNILTGILQGSKETQDSISLNAEQIEKLRAELVEKDQLYSRQDQAIATLEKQVVALARQVADLQESLQSSREQASYGLTHIEARHGRWRLVTFGLFFVPVAWLAWSTWF